MDDLISRQAAIELCDWYEHEYCECNYVIKALADDFKSLPTAEKKGKWIKDRLCSTDGGTYGVRRCSECEHYYQDVVYGWNYCPNCGAKMMEESDE